MSFAWPCPSGRSCLGVGDGWLVRDVPDADGDVVPRRRTLAFGLADMHYPSLDGREPLIDVVFVRRLHDCLAVAAYEREDLHSLLHRWPSMLPFPDDARSSARPPPQGNAGY